MQTSSRLAIYALLELAGAPERHLSVSDIGEKYRVSAHHLAKVMHALGRAGLVQASRGVGGGYVFVGNARRLTLLDVIELFEDLSSDCKLVDSAVARPAEWALYDVNCEIDEIARATYGSITLATMLKQIARRERRAEAKAAPADGAGSERVAE